MTLIKSLGTLAAAGMLLATTQSSQATETFSSSATLKFKATIQDKVEDETKDGYQNTTVNVTIVNKDILAAFEDWYDVTLPSGASLALDTSYNLVIVNKDGDIIYDATDLDGFLTLSYSDSITSNGRYKEKDNGDYTDSFDDTYGVEIDFLTDNDRSASIDTGNDYAYTQGLDVFSYSDSYDASKNDYKETTTDKATLMGTGNLENSDAILSGEFKSKYVYKNDNYEK